jgi:hypothetical protein
MKKLGLVIAVVLSTSVQALTVNELMRNPKTALTAFGVAEYYTYNCSGLTSRGQQLITNVFYRHGFNKVDAVDLMNTDEFKLGYEVSGRYTCNNLRSVLTDAGAGALIR